MASAESAAGVPETVSVAETALPEPRGTMDRRLLDELWRASAVPSWGLERDEFDRIIADAGIAQNFGLDAGVAATRRQQAEFFRGLRLDDLVLARACTAGIELAWEHFIAQHRQPLIRAAIAITGSETLGRDLADQLYAELYGLNMREGERRCPLLSYRGRGSLMGWLRTTLAQRHVDHHRRCRREQPLGEIDVPAAVPSPQTPGAELSQLERAIEQALEERDAEERFLLAAYYLDGQTLLQIARVLEVHEATVSRKLRRATEETRKQVLRNLRRDGLSRRAAEETLGADPRDLEVNLKQILQNSQSEAFKEQAAP
ncbi:MAG: sigma-70 family RNA polymerase sigma factor [Terracidiphilus sp.]|jgi:RNA polymerase sigma-70 factor, ECF subfamily